MKVIVGHFLMMLEKYMFLFLLTSCVIKRRPLKHHHNELYSLIPKIEIVRNGVHVLSKEYLFSIFVQVKKTYA